VAFRLQLSRDLRSWRTLPLGGRAAFKSLFELDLGSRTKKIYQQTYRKERSRPPLEIALS